MIYKKLSEISINNKGYYGIGASSCEKKDDMPQYLRITDISDDGRIPSILPTCIDKNEYSDYGNYILNKGDLLLARTGNSTGRNHLYKKDDRNTVFAGFLIKFSLNDKLINPYYVGYYCQSKNYYNQIDAMITGSTRPNINAEQYGDLLIPIYDSITQQHIVDSIGSVDDAIEKNEEIMSSFQKYIKSLYLTYAAKTKETIKLSNLITKSGTLLKNSEWHNEKVIDLSTMPQDNICIITDSNGADFSTNIKTLKDNTLLYGSIRPYFKKCGFTVNHSYVAGTIHTFKVIDEKYFTYILATICSDGFHNYTNTNSQGTKMPIINWETFVNYDVPLVSKNELNDFYCKTVDIYNFTKILMNKTMILKLLKQALLNKYFS